jgi:hypothetical protein
MQHEGWGFLTSAWTSAIGQQAAKSNAGFGWKADIRGCAGGYAGSRRDLHVNEARRRSGVPMTSSPSSHRATATTSPARPYLRRRHGVPVSVAAFCGVAQNAGNWRLASQWAGACCRVAGIGATRCGGSSSIKYPGSNSATSANLSQLRISTRWLTNVSRPCARISCSVRFT